MVFSQGGGQMKNSEEKKIFTTVVYILKLRGMF